MYIRPAQKYLKTELFLTDKENMPLLFLQNKKKYLKNDIKKKTFARNFYRSCIVLTFENRNKEMTKRNLI